MCAEIRRCVQTVEDPDSLNKYIPNAYHLPETSLGSGDTVTDKADVVSDLAGLIGLIDENSINQIITQHNKPQW